MYTLAMSKDVRVGDFVKNPLTEDISQQQAQLVESPNISSKPISDVML